jgi:hypothetical protein
MKKGSIRKALNSRAPMKGRTKAVMDLTRQVLMTEAPTTV